MAIISLKNNLYDMKSITLGHCPATIRRLPNKKIIGRYVSNAGRKAVCGCKTDTEQSTPQNQKPL